MTDFRQLGQSLRQAQDDWTALDAKYRAVKPRPMPDDESGPGVIPLMFGGAVTFAVVLTLALVFEWVVRW